MSELNLGRNLNDLMEENDFKINDNEEVKDIEIRDIRPNPDQPRSIFENQSIKELAVSIKEYGVIQPIIVKKGTNGYILVAGERRVRASKIAGYDTIPAIIRDYNSIHLGELAILENLQREDLTPIEEAIAFKKMLSSSKMTHEQLGEKIGKSRTYVTNSIGLLKLPAIIIEDVNSKRLTMGHARALSKLKDVVSIMRLRDRVLSESLSVRDLERLIREMTKTDVEILSVTARKTAESSLKDYIPTELKYKLGKNQLVLKFSNEEELKKILDYLKGAK